MCHIKHHCGISFSNSFFPWPQSLSLAPTGWRYSQMLIAYSSCSSKEWAPWSEGSRKRPWKLSLTLDKSWPKCYLFLNNLPFFCCFCFFLFFLFVCLFVFLSKYQHCVAQSRSHEKTNAGSVLSLLTSSLKHQCPEAFCLHNFTIENRLLLLSFGLLFFFCCYSSSILVLFQNLLQLNEEGFFWCFPVWKWSFLESSGSWSWDWQGFSWQNYIKK